MTLSPNLCSATSLWEVLVLAEARMDVQPRSGSYALTPLDLPISLSQGVSGLAFRAEGLRNTCSLMSCDYNSRNISVFLHPIPEPQSTPAPQMLPRLGFSA